MSDTNGNGTRDAIGDLRERNRRVEDRVENLRIEIGERMDTFDARQIELLKAVSELQVKSGIWGGVSGVVGAALVLVAYIVNGK